MSRARCCGLVSILVMVLGGWAAGTSAQTYVPPAGPRADINLDLGWRFTTNDVSGAQAVNFNDSAWSKVNLPHTWNNMDGQTTNYYRGVGWYRRHYSVDGSQTNRVFFLKFEGANLVSDVYVNGSFVGKHQGGYSAFAYDVTPYLNVGGDNVIAVKVNNANVSTVSPVRGDYTKFGGIYRDVHLLVTEPVQVSPLDYGSPGVYLKPTDVGSNSAHLQITTVVSNAASVAANVAVRAVITDAATNIVTTLTNVLTLPAASLSNVVSSTVILNPHLWNGLEDPYLYRVYVEVYKGTNLTDWVSQPLGFRWFTVDPTNGFLLNGRQYDLHGVCYHQDWLNCGNALTNAQHETNFALLREMGVTVVRMVHYQHNEYEYQLADKAGICVWTEVANSSGFTLTSAYSSNVVQQLRELIRQNYNHPSIICWGLFNEINASNTNFASQLAQVAAQEDPTRPSTAASNVNYAEPLNWCPDLVGFNVYYGWYKTPISGIAAWADKTHSRYPTRCFGIGETGAGASIYQHSEDPVAWPTTTSNYHPEEWQNLYHEANWPLMQMRPYLWIKAIWLMFDLASATRNEGDTPGRNDKGLVTYDRQVRKDAFYFYKANWTTNPMVYITGHTFTNRLTNSITAKVYANCDSVELFLNGISQGSKSSTNCIFTWPITLDGGSNYVQAAGIKGGSHVTDSLAWFGPIPPPTLSAGLYFQQQPTDNLVGAALAPPVTVVATNASGVPVTHATISLSLASGTGALNGTLSQVTDNNGVATFADLVLTAAGSKQLQVAEGTNTVLSTTFSLTNASTPNSGSIAVVDELSAAATGTSSSISASAQVTSGANALLVMLATKGGSSAYSDPASLAWNGQTLKRAVTATDGASTYRNASIYYLYNPATDGAAHAITGTGGSGTVFWELKYLTLSGVDTSVVSPWAGSAGADSSSSSSLSLSIGNCPNNGWAAVCANASATAGYVITFTGTGGTANTISDYLNSGSTGSAVGMGYISGLTPAGTNIFTASVPNKSALAVVVFAPALPPPTLAAQVIGNQLQLSWPSPGWRLQIQTNALGQGISTNWAVMPNSTTVTATNILISPANGSVFLRLISP